MAGRTLPRVDTPHFDFAALHARPSRAELRRFAKTNWTSGLRRRVLASGVRSVLTIAAMIVIVLAALAFGVLGLGIFTGPSVNAFGLPFIVFALVLLGFLTWLCLARMARTIRFGVGWARRMRLQAFARANGLIFVPEVQKPAFSGSLFALAKSGEATNVMATAQGRNVLFGNFRNTGASVFSRLHFDWGFLMIEMDRAVPHMLLESKRQRSKFRPSIGLTLASKQTLSLEGDFDMSFTLFVPHDYERDALYIFTPDLMALLMDRASRFDVEIVDNWLYVYSRKRFDLTDPATHERLAQIVHRVAHKTVNQTGRYSDDRLADPGTNAVAAHGRRLKLGVSAGSVIVIAFFVVRIILALMQSHS